ncbi:hypothetical protein [Paracidovorax cattleyae]|uniref:Uncharacterized protein n=1 Tax=Paracidovorax cattleyae TaxID=80868 RepID=A0A1H0RKG4_9BURK|nr:hypothetical protein [Paracidovorax cattleyae]AVS73924.1 hypothetical protein C8240_07625 [Paracidovorax cattleyae]SDP29418.1 hypothetical protein SAMN04489708_11087 [Paracidovorax cattleyae]
MTPVQIVLAVLVVGNIATGWAWLGARDDATTARAELAAKGQELAGVRGAAQACSTAVDELRTLADRRAREAEAARRAAGVRAAAHDRKADAILAAPPAVPGDACASAQHRVDAWLQGRAQP